MRYINIIKFDIKHSLISMFPKYIFFSLIMAIAFLGCKGFFNSFDYSNIGISSCLLYIYGGTKEYIPTLGEPFKLPYIWLINHLFILYFTLNYIKGDLNGFGMQILFRTGSRNLWWLSKCLWQLVTVSLFYLISWFVIIVLYCSCYDANFFSEISYGLAELIEFGENKKIDCDFHLTTELILMPWLFSVSMAMVQMCMSLFIKSIFSYLISAIICIASSFKLTPFFIGNYAMAVRNQKVITDGLITKIGIIIYVILIIVAVFIGLVRFNKYSIIEKE